MNSVMVTARGRCRVRYDPQCGPGPTTVSRDLTELYARRGIVDMRRRACAGVGTTLVSECLRRPLAGVPLRGDEKSRNGNGNNNFNVLDRRWRRFSGRTSRVPSSFDDLPYTSLVEAGAARSSLRSHDALQTRYYPEARSIRGALATNFDINGKTSEQYGPRLKL